MNYKYQITLKTAQVILAKDYYVIEGVATITGVGKKGEYKIEVSKSDILEIKEL